MTDKTVSKPTSIFALFGTDRDAEEAGKWFDIGPETKIKVRRFKSQHATRVREALEKPYERMRKAGVLPKEIMEKVLHKTICQSIIADWKGVFGPEGEEIPFSAEAADELLTALPEFRDEITTISLSMDNFRAEDDKKIEGNS